MSAEPVPVEEILVTERPLWLDGPPHELFKRMRAECPVHWTPRITEYPGEAGFWSVTLADDIHEVSHDWRTYSSERGGITALTEAVMPLDLIRAMFIGMDPPKHHPLKALFQPRSTADPQSAIYSGKVLYEERPAQGALPAPLHAQADRRTRGAHPRAHRRRPEPERGPRAVRPGDRGRPACRLARNPQLHGHPAG